MTTEAVRRANQVRQKSVRAAANRRGVSATTIQKWRRRTTTIDAGIGPKELRSTMLTADEEVLIVAFRRRTPLDDCLSAPQANLPRLSRSTQYRRLERHLAPA